MKNKVLYLNSNTFTKAAPSEDGENIEIEGYSNTVEKDRHGDVIPAEAWESGIKHYLDNPVILAFHNHSEPVGRMVEHRIDGMGLWIKARISSASEKVFKLVKDGLITAFSVGFMVKDADYNPEADVFVIKELELYEISLVSVGSNRSSLFNMSKSFENNDDFEDFKLQFAPAGATSAKGLDKSAEESTNKEEFDMDSKELQKLLAEASKSAVDEVLRKQQEEKDALEAAKAKEKDIQDRVDAAVAKATAASKPTDDVSVGDSGAEKLLADIEKRFQEESDKNKSVIEGLEAALKEKADEVAAIQKSKMHFSEGESKDVSYQEKENAILMAKILKKGVDATTYGKQLLEKAGPHVASATWELEVSRNMEQEVRRRLVVAPMLRAIPMMTNVMTIPVNPEAGIATWIQNSEFGTSSSSGSTQTHQLGEITLNAYKVATREYVHFEEEEDSLLILLPIIRDAMVRRLARAVDRAYLRGAGTASDPVKGIAAYDASSSVTKAVGSSFTVSDMKALRKDLGAWGLDPSELRYVVSTEVYYDLLEDTTFDTVDKVGDRATLLTGQIGSVGNTPVTVSAEFEAKGATEIGAICFAPGNFVSGNQRGLRMDTDDLVVDQQTVLVGSMRTGMVQTTTNLGAGVSAFQWTA